MNIHKTLEELSHDPVYKFGLIVIWVIALLVITCLSCHAEELKASWYSVASLKRDGQWSITKGVMSNGKAFSDSRLTAASRDWPLGTWVEVRNLANGKSVNVEITDRINKRFAHKRIDLSKMAFSRIGELKKGIVKVRVEKLVKVAGKL